MAASNGTNPEPPAARDRRGADDGPVLNVPNTICALRLAGAPVLVFVAFQGHTTAFAWLFAALYFSDWIDGKLAIVLDQRTTFGARLDSIADVALYTALVAGVWLLKEDVVREEALWLLAALAGYAGSCIVAKLRFGRLPSYHTRLAKTCWLLTGIAAVAVFLEWSRWPLRVAAGAVFLANHEAILITLVLPRWEADVPSLYHAIRRARRSGARTPADEA